MQTSKSESNKRIAKNTIYLYIRLIVVMFISLYSVRIVMAELGVEGFGTFNVVAGFVTMLGFIGTTMTMGIQRFFNYEMGKKGDAAAIEVYSSALKIQFVCALIIFVLFETIGLWYVNNVMNLPKYRITEINFLYQFAITSLVLNVLVVPYNAFTIAKEHMNWYALISMLEAIGKLLIAFSLSLFTDNKLAVYGFLLMLIAIFNFWGYFFLCKRKYSWLKYRGGVNNGLVKQILSFSGWNALSAFANIGKAQGINLLLNNFFGVAINAANAIVTQIYSAVQLFSINICTAFKPQLTESYAQGDYSHVKQMMFLMSKSAFMMVYIICIPLFLELPFILNIWLGKNVPEYTESFTIVTLFVILVGSLNTPISQIIYANGNIKKYILVYSLICLCLPLGWLAFYLGASAITVFFITLGLMVLIQVISLVILKNYMDYSYSEYIISIIIPCTVFAILTPIVPYAIHILIADNDWLRLLIVTFSTIFASAVSGWFVILTKNQRCFLTEKIKSMFKRASV